MPLLDVAGRLKLPPAQMGGSCENTGTSIGFTATVMVVGMAQGCRAKFGVKV